MLNAKIFLVKLEFKTVSGCNSPTGRHRKGRIFPAGIGGGIVFRKTASREDNHGVTIREEPWMGWKAFQACPATRAEDPFIYPPEIIFFPDLGAVCC